MFGVKNYDMFNKDLMCKWGWKILVEEESLWHKVLSFKYAEIKNQIRDDYFSFFNSNYSLWLRDLCIFLGA